MNRVRGGARQVTENERGQAVSGEREPDYDAMIEACKEQICDLDWAIEELRRIKHGGPPQKIGPGRRGEAGEKGESGGID